jgi:hypothetical protein
VNALLAAASQATHDQSYYGTLAVLGAMVLLGIVSVKK